ncbi:MULTISPECIES: CehA/McbA family metallohydrolase [unclassified Bacillus (in: firmicutes)]|uniref:CehA/McbA family metallohydrolase n=1 Tax=unclassified Bacillus (in: firmicutes) TaxID=185979 RepID=UPI0008EC1411|nr:MULTISPECIES: CehA/McbA family metallohydrolase [unclassified Bacillus (in: firmicutes)]SFB04402.1 hypothetical protein SAMN02799634_104292 [Bacillus sp. UNCCL13]SFQ88510.1 hypothetical protein SAMN04488577_3222 [Bacillus sp. cl95]
MTISFSTELNGVIDTPFLCIPMTIDQEYNWLELELSFSKKGWFSILIWGPNGTLRNQCLYINEPKTIKISANADESTYGSVSGVIPAGKWKLEILCATHHSKPEYQISYRVGSEISSTLPHSTENWSTSPIPNGFELNLFDVKKKRQMTKKWLKGDFHTHTNESDGKMTAEKGMEQAKKMGLDFFVATDHNILPTKWLEDDLIVIPGIEITSSKGHFNAIGLTQWVDWRPNALDGGMETAEGMSRILREVKEAGAIASINHPMLKPWEWQYKSTLLTDFDIIEIWNDPTYKDNPEATEKAIKLWDTLWNDGHHMFAIGGSDSHLLPTESYEKNGPPSVIGDPATYVLADEYSAQGILKGVRQGKVYISRGPILDVIMNTNGKEITFGSNLTDVIAEEIYVSIVLDYCEVPKGSILKWIKDGEEIDRSEFENSSGQIHANFTFPKDETTWLRFEIRGENGELLSIANPIFRGNKTPKLKTWGDLLEAAGYGDFLKS